MTRTQRIHKHHLSPRGKSFERYDEQTKRTFVRTLIPTWNLGRMGVCKYRHVRLSNTGCFLSWLSFYLLFVYHQYVSHGFQANSELQLIPRVYRLFPAPFSKTTESIPCGLPSSTAVIVAFQEKRFENIRLIIAELKKLCFMSEVIVWNNNDQVRYLSNDSFVEVINSRENVGTIARYKACIRAGTSACYMIDDDWLPIHVEMLYYVYLRHSGAHSVVLTDARTQFMDYTYTFHRNNRYFSFAWLGVGSFVPKAQALKFLDLVHLIDETFIRHEDIFFSLFSDTNPIVVSADIIPLKEQANEASMSAASSYLEFQMKAFVAALNTVVANPVTFSPNEHINVERKSEDVRAICSDGRAFVISNAIPVSLAHSEHHGNDELAFSVNEISQTLFAGGSYKEICEKSARCLFMNGVLAGMYIGYEFVNPIKASSLTMIVKSTSRLDSTIFKLDAVNVGQTVFEHIPHELQIDVRSVSSGHSMKGYVVLDFVFSQTQELRVIRLMARRKAKVSICELLINTVGESGLDLVQSLSTNLAPVMKYEPDKPKADVNLMVAITSSSQNHLRRRAIRRIMRHWPSALAGVKFFIGSSSDAIPDIDEEASIYGDIVQQTIDEGYNSLTLRTIKIFDWVSHNMKRTDFVLKMDDDTFVELEIVLATLRRLKGQSLYMGHFFNKQEVYHTALEKNYEPFYEGEYYPPYASGSGYILSMDLVNYILLSWKSKPSLRLFRNEDVSVGIWLLGLDIVRLHRVDFWPEPPSPCKQDMNITLIHRADPEQMQHYYKNFRSHGHICAS